MPYLKRALSCTDWSLQLHQSNGRSLPAGSSLILAARWALSSGANNTSCSGNCTAMRDVIEALTVIRCMCLCSIRDGAGGEVLCRTRRRRRPPQRHATCLRPKEQCHCQSSVRSTCCECTTVSIASSRPRVLQQAMHSHAHVQVTLLNATISPVILSCWSRVWMNGLKIAHSLPGASGLLAVGADHRANSG